MERVRKIDVSSQISYRLPETPTDADYVDLGRIVAEATQSDLAKAFGIDRHFMAGALAHDLEHFFVSFAKDLHHFENDRRFRDDRPWVVGGLRDSQDRLWKRLSARALLADPRFLDASGAR